ncbi:MAG: vWA domain-containing protein [Gaiellaceae bacterium]
MSSIPLADAPAFRPAARRTFAVSTAIGLLLLAAVVAVVFVARQPHTRTVVSLPTHSDAIVVLDLSASISSDTYSRIGATLDTLAHSTGHYGLVVFSDEAYEALPPGTPAADLAPLVRYFTLGKQTTPGFAPAFPTNPWQNVFSAGTRISAGLELARTIALDDKLQRPALILISDLEDDPNDLTRLQFIGAGLQQARIPLRVVGLNPSPRDVAVFRRIVGSVQIAPARLHAAGPHASDSTPVPWTLVVLVLAVAALLAAGELWGPLLDVEERA